MYEDDEDDETIGDIAPEPSRRSGGEAKMTAATGLDPKDHGEGRASGLDDRSTPRTTTTSRPTSVIVAALVAGLIVGAIGGALVASRDSGGDQFAGVVDASRYQAVILSNDKVYFGQLTDVSDDFFRLDRAFFLRETRESADAEPVRALLPVNREIHAPDNTMLIRKSEVVLVENLEKESPILAEIRRQLGDKG